MRAAVRRAHAAAVRPARLDEQQPALVNGPPAILTVVGDQVVGSVTFDLADGKIATVRGIAAPARLVRLTEAWQQHGPDTPLISQW